MQYDYETAIRLYCFGLRSLALSLYLSLSGYLSLSLNTKAVHSVGSRFGDLHRPTVARATVGGHSMGGLFWGRGGKLGVVMLFTQRICLQSIGRVI